MFKLISTYQNILSWRQRPVPVYIGVTTPDPLTIKKPPEELIPSPLISMLTIFSPNIEGSIQFLKFFLFRNVKVGHTVCNQSIWGGYGESHRFFKSNNIAPIAENAQKRGWIKNLPIYMILMDNN